MGQQFIQSLSVRGGFLDGLTLDFQPGLNCILGGRGTGKTTVLELLRFVLVGRDSQGVAADERRQVDALIKANLADGRVQVTIATASGTSYLVSRSWGDDPVVQTKAGKPVGFTVDSTGVFPVEIFRQKEIDTIAFRSAAQLELLDKFASDRIQALEFELGQVAVALTANSHKIIPLQAEITSLDDSLHALPSIEDRLKQFSADVGSDEAPANQAHRYKALRDREVRVLNKAQESLSQYEQDITAMSGWMARLASSLHDAELATSPNAGTLATLARELTNTNQAVDQLFENLLSIVRGAKQRLATGSEHLRQTHIEQELEFRTLIERHETARRQSAERSVLDRSRNELLVKRHTREECGRRLQDLLEERNELLEQLSRLRDERFNVRQQIAASISQKLRPQIRVSVTHYGNLDEYRDRLEALLKGVGVRQGLVAQRIASSMSPGQFAELIRARDAQALIEQAELNNEQVWKILAALGDSPAVYELETTEMADRPNIELLDGEDYKPLASISGGQKCTTILPILLLDREYPLLIDQPEDNLDNRFIYDAIVENVRSAKQNRQLIFVTHNANIPVLGEADRLFVLESNGRVARKVAEGKIDDCLGAVVALLEGGERAFKRRRDRYSF